MEGQKKMVCTFAIGRQKILNYLSDVLASNTYINGGHFRPPSCFITRSKMSGFKLTFCASMRILVMEEPSSAFTPYCVSAIGGEEAPVSPTGARLVGLA